jgi:hypothetical protein
MNAATNGCGCGGACGCKGGCDGGCCGLECLQRPNFYCGQLLTDADLSAMVDWARGRFGLARFRHGWGIACGLDLSCGAPDDPAACCGDTPATADPAVYLNAGYAIDCCGNDLVVCEPLRIDLAPVCRPSVDPCAPLPQPAPPEDANADAQDGLDCLRIPPGELFAVRLSLRYHEDLAQGRRALFRGPCADDGSCQYARVLERPCVHLEEVALAPEAVGQDAQERWHQDFQRGAARQAAALRAAVGADSAAILRHIRHNPPYRFCHLEDTVCCLRANERPDRPVPPQQWLDIARLQMLDWTLRQLACPCPSCLPDDGVPLGRVVMRRRVVDGRTRCSVVMIEQDEAWRRPLHKTPCRPADATRRDLAPYLWQPADSLEDLRGPGVNLNVVDTHAADLDQLKQMVDTFGRAVVAFDPAVDHTLDVHLVDDFAGKARIALFVTP